MIALLIGLGVVAFPVVDAYLIRRVLASEQGPRCPAASTIATVLAGPELLAPQRKVPFEVPN